MVRSMRCRLAVEAPSIPYPHRAKWGKGRDWSNCFKQRTHILTMLVRLLLVQDRSKSRKQSDARHHAAARILGDRLFGYRHQ